jgi:hypothetical protein
MKLSRDTTRIGTHARRSGRRFNRPISVPRRLHPVDWATGRQADRPPTEMFEEGAAIAICFAPEHCVLLER